MKEGSLRKTLNIRLSLTILFAGLLAGLLYYAYVGNKAETELEHYANTLTKGFSSNLALHLWNFDNESLEQTSNTLLESQAVVGITILNVRNQTAFDVGGYSDPNILKISREIYYQEEYVGHADIYFSTSQVNETKNNTIIVAVLIISSIVLFCISIMDFAIKWLVIRPLHELVEFSNRVGEGELDATVSTKFENEIGILFHSVNQMTQRLHKTVVTQKKVEDELKRSNAELEEFAYRTSHDLRSPLVSSIGLLNLVEKTIESDKPGTALEIVEQVQKSLRKLEDLVKDILQLTRIKNEGEDVQVIDIETSVTEAIEKFRNLDNFERLDIRKSLDFADELQTQKSRFILVLENLISNAIKYQDASKESSFITISTYSDNGSFVLEVQDNGLGVPKDKQDKLFTMFKRFHPRTSFGSGLGLYMTKKSVDVIGGVITFADTGEGSAFTLSIPVSQKTKPL